jgi:hypothetical protein
MLKIELLEDRLVPAVIPIMGTDGDDSWVVSGKGRNVTVTQTLANGIPASIVTQFSNVDRLELDLKGGNDTFVTTANVPITGSLGAGNDQLRSDGAEGQSVMVDGGDGDDLLVGGRSLDSLAGGAGNDIIIGQGQADWLDGGAGDDLVIGGHVASSVSLSALAQAWQASSSALHQRVVGVLRMLNVTDDGYADTISSSPGFDLTYNDTARQFSVNPDAVGRTLLVATASEFQSAIAQAVAGDKIVLAAGEYQLNGSITRNLAGVTIQGAGMDRTILRGGSFKLNHAGNNLRTILKDMTLDITGQTASGGYHTFAHGAFVLERIEVTGAGLSLTAAVAFRTDTGARTHGIIVGGEYHDTPGDVISTSGLVSNSAASALSLLELFDIVGHTSGPLNQDQVLTGHFNFRAVDVGGRYSNAVNNVIAPDSNTVIDLYFTTTTPGARSSNIWLTRQASVIEGADITANQIQIGGLLLNSTVRTASSAGGSLINALFSGTQIRNNRIIQSFPGSPKMGVRLSTSRISVIDNVFEDWAGKELLIIGGSSTITGNDFL